MVDELHDDNEPMDGDFAKMLEESLSTRGRLKPGQQVTTRVIKVTGEWVFIEVGGKGEGVLDRRELLDENGDVTVAEGDNVTAWFVGVQHGEMRFTTKVGSGASGSSQLEDAYNSGIPVEGFVEKEIKGGFEIKIGGSTRAFCPYSQIAARRVENAAAFVGQHLKFKITQYGERGRNSVVSARALAEEEQQRQREELRGQLQAGQTVSGTVTSLQKFGAFVNIGGVEGLVPMAELGWTRVADAAEVVQVGQQVQVVIKQLDWENNRISLSLRETLADPWQRVAVDFPEGSYQPGKVVRLANFGAFVSLAGGIDGLIPIGRLGSGKKINHPREVLSEGQEVEVKVESVDVAGRRISLSLAAASRAAEEEAQSVAAFKQGDSVAGMGTLGDLLKAKLKK
jgi:small subunit ribosomal protein S1